MKSLKREKLSQLNKRRKGTLLGTLIISTYEINNRFHNIVDMALVQSLNWVLIEDLAGHQLQELEEELNTIEGSDGFEVRIELMK